MSSTTDQKSLTFVESAGTALAAAEKLAHDVNDEKQAALKLAGPLSQVMIDGQLIEAQEQPVLLDKLANHDGALEVVGNLVSYIGKQKSAYAQKLAVAQGGGAPTNGHSKAASDDQDSNGTPYVGRRAGLGEKRASDDPLRRLAGLGD